MSDADTTDQELAGILQTFWGYDRFRPMQEDIIRSVINKHDTLAILPTGGGKSICFQVPALAQEGICLVISPLIALMKDQVENLRKKNIPALMIHSAMKREDVVRTLKNATEDYFKFLYLSPERLETSLFKEYLPAMNINLIAVDESHCISQWGYDFRPSYLRIAALREEVPDVPVLALTASATPEVQADICTKLAFAQPGIFRQSFERKNLSYSVFNVASKLSRLVEIVKKVAGTGIVYCKSRRRTGEISELLRLHGISCTNYHAGLNADERSARQADWIAGKTRIMACTNAFGMGIDKPDVRLVVHIDTPDCLENYYQEAGRAGRDGKKAYAVLIFDNSDVTELENMHRTRFPDLEEIREVYRALVNFLQIPAYTGEYRKYNFSFEDFLARFRLPMQSTMFALKALESDGWLDFNEKSFAPSTVVFTSTRRELEDFEGAHPDLAPLLITLLRSYGGIFDFPVFISEKLLAKLLKTSETTIKESLAAASSYRIIQYTPQNDLPQITFLKNRVNADEMLFNLQLYNQRKDVFQQRVAKMIEYTATADCRSLFINRYFGDDARRDCGICDNCLARKKRPLTATEFDAYAKKVLQLLATGAADIDSLNASLRELSREKLIALLEFLQAEKKIVAHTNGSFQLLRK